MKHHHATVAIGYDPRHVSAAPSEVRLDSRFPEEACRRLAVISRKREEERHWPACVCPGVHARGRLVRAPLLIPDSISSGERSSPTGSNGMRSMTIGDSAQGTGCRCQRSDDCAACSHSRERLLDRFSSRSSCVQGLSRRRRKSVDRRARRGRTWLMIVETSRPPLMFFVGRSVWMWNPRPLLPLVI